VKTFFAVCALPILAVLTLQTQDAGLTLSDAAGMQQLLQKFNVPGVSIAIIKDFKIETAVAYGVADFVHAPRRQQAFKNFAKRAIHRTMIPWLHGPARAHRGGVGHS
jgi:hypothetical protein